jgi:hypothetical protein
MSGTSARATERFFRMHPHPCLVPAATRAAAELPVIVARSMHDWLTEAEIKVLQAGTNKTPTRAREDDARRDKPARSRLTVRLLVRLYRPLVRSAARAALEGRRRDRDRPELGRFLRADVNAFLDDVWVRVATLLGEEDLNQIPTLGNRHNVFLGALTIAAFHALLDRGVEPRYAMELFADVGWKVYERMLKLPYFFARIRTRDLQGRMSFALKALMRFPFSSPGEPGYAVHAWSESGRFHTDWTYCAPLGFVKRYVERHGDRGELEAFYQSWCLYDWPAADLLSGGREGEHGHYEREHTLSRGDSVCDMCWSASSGTCGNKPRDSRQ